MPPRKNNPKAPFVAKPQHQFTAEELAQQEADKKQAGQSGQYSDRIKIEPRFTMPEHKLPSDTEIHNQMQTDTRTT